MSGLFITSSGTGIGKTYLVESLLAYDRHAGQILSATKPIISDWSDDPQRIRASDTGLILQAMGKPISARTIDAISPWRFTAPLSPDLAQAIAGTRIDFAELIGFCTQQIKVAAQQGEIHLIEGVGGVMCPILAGITVLDWVTALQCRCVLVVGSYLGTLSHTLSAIHALHKQDIEIAAIVMCQTPNSSVSMQLNGESLQHFIGKIPLFLCENPPQNPSAQIAKIYASILQTQQINSNQTIDTEEISQ